MLGTIDWGWCDIERIGGQRDLSRLQGDATARRDTLQYGSEAGDIGQLACQSAAHAAVQAFGDLAGRVECAGVV